MIVITIVIAIIIFITALQVLLLIINIMVDNKPIHTYNDVFAVIFVTISNGARIREDFEVPTNVGRQL